MMKFITLYLNLLLVTAAEAEAATTRSSIFTATSVISFVNLANAQYYSADTGICTGGATHCSVFAGDSRQICPAPWCAQHNEECNAGYKGESTVACSVLSEDQCKAASEIYYSSEEKFTPCKWVPISGNQRAINGV
jgi:hypothetical protein